MGSQGAHYESPKKNIGKNIGGDDTQSTPNLPRYEIVSEHHKLV
jgi:hypothetical protein